MEEKTSKGKMKSEKHAKLDGKLLAIIRISGEVKVKPDVKFTLDRLRLRRKYSCILINASNKGLVGMLKKVRFAVAFGIINTEILSALLKARAKSIENKKFNPDEAAIELMNGKKLEQLGLKPFFRLHPPRGGINSKLQYPRGVLGDNKENINKLLMRML